MIDEVDEAVRTLIRQEALNGTQVEVVFDAPTKEWSSRRNSPTLDVYLYDIREDLRRRETGVIDVHNDVGRITGRRHPPRHFKLSYLVTAWTQRPEDEHRLLSAVLACFVRHDKLPADVLQGSLADQALPVRVTVALPPARGPSLVGCVVGHGWRAEALARPGHHPSGRHIDLRAGGDPRHRAAPVYGLVVRGGDRATVRVVSRVRASGSASSGSADARSEGKAVGLD